MNKKGADLWLMIIVLIIALVFLFISLPWITKVFKGTSSVTDVALSESSYKACKAQGSKAAALLGGLKDCDEDGLPDSCDPCPDIKDGFTDSDGDHYSDICEYYYALKLKNPKTIWPGIDRIKSQILAFKGTIDSKTKDIPEPMRYVLDKDLNPKTVVSIEGNSGLKSYQFYTGECNQLDCRYNIWCPLK